jgi:NAD/NADP transhydrogenase alpha subunit
MTCILSQKIEPKEVFEGENRVAIGIRQDLQKLGYDCVRDRLARASGRFRPNLQRRRRIGCENSRRPVESRRYQAQNRMQRSSYSRVKVKRWFLYPAQNSGPDGSRFQQKKAQPSSLWTWCRISRAQKMDALSSMANIAWATGSYCMA